jgi:hypothetical protein
MNRDQRIAHNKNIAVVFHIVEDYVFPTDRCMVIGIHLVVPSASAVVARYNRGLPRTYRGLMWYLDGSEQHARRTDQDSEPNSKILIFVLTEDSANSGEDNAHGQLARPRTTPERRSFITGLSRTLLENSDFRFFLQGWNNSVLFAGRALPRTSTHFPFSVWRHRDLTKSRARTFRCA